MCCNVVYFFWNEKMNDMRMWQYHFSKAIKYVLVINYIKKGEA